MKTKKDNTQPQNTKEDSSDVQKAKNLKQAPPPQPNNFNRNNPEQGSQRPSEERPKS